ncbi:MAG: hypothetical protein ACE5D2_05170 [Fidelibacterota bacterium]
MVVIDALEFIINQRFKFLLVFSGGVTTLNSVMEKTPESTITVKFKPDYQWPKPGTVRNCPKCDHPLELQNNVPEYSGKPWWCPSCQWQFSEEDLKKTKRS